MNFIAPLTGSNWTETVFWRVFVCPWLFTAVNQLEIMAGKSGKEQVQDWFLLLFLFFVFYKNEKKVGGNTLNDPFLWKRSMSLPPTCKLAPRSSATQNHDPSKLGRCQTGPMWSGKSSNTREARVTTSNRRPRGGEGEDGEGKKSPGESPRRSPRVSKSSLSTKAALKAGRGNKADTGFEVQIPDLQGASVWAAGSRQVRALSGVHPPPLPSGENSMRSGRSFQAHWLAGSAKLWCGGSCGRSQWRLPPTPMRGPRRWTRSAPPCGGPGWCGSAGPPGSATPWAGSSGGRGCRSWSRPVCWPSGESHVHTAARRGGTRHAEQLRNRFHISAWIKIQGNCSIEKRCSPTEKKKAPNKALQILCKRFSVLRGALLSVFPSKNQRAAASILYV